MASTSVFLNVQDITKAVAFYEALGFERTHETKADDGTLWYVDLARDGAEVGLGAIAANEDGEFQEWVSTPLGAGVVVYFSVDDPVDAIHEKARAAGAVVESPPADRPYGRALTLNDPDGYTLTFLNES